jgi:hypothetical protein
MQRVHTSVASVSVLISESFSSSPLLPARKSSQEW